MSNSNRNSRLTNETVMQWHKQFGVVECTNKVFEAFPDEGRTDFDVRSMKGRISYLASAVKRCKSVEERKQTLAKEFVAPTLQRKGTTTNNNNDIAEDLTQVSLKDYSHQKELRPRRTKQVTESEVDDDSNDSSDALTGRRRGNAGRVNYNVKDMTANNKTQLVHDAQGRLISSGQDCCDCLESSCPGCHYPCLKCESPKCGSECRSRRKWLYEHILVEGTEFKIHNPAH